MTTVLYHHKLPFGNFIVFFGVLQRYHLIMFSPHKKGWSNYIGKSAIHLGCVSYTEHSGHERILCISKSHSVHEVHHYLFVDSIWFVGHFPKCPIHMLVYRVQCSHDVSIKGW